MSLFGRDAEIKYLAELIGGVEDRGGALIVRGEPGIGKSALLAEASSIASASGMRVLTITGVEAEQGPPYAGLHQLIYPIRAGMGALTGPQCDALRGALGLADVAAPSGPLVGLATLTLLAEEAVHRPLFLVAEDAHWLDSASSDVLAFVARRLESEPIVLVASAREGSNSPLADVDLPSVDLNRLSEDVAGELLDSVAPGLTPAIRSRLLREADGNPLALTELPASVGSLDGLDPVLPLTDRLRYAFTARIAGLPVQTRTGLLVAALNDSPSVAEVLEATGGVLGRSVELDILTPAIDARLIELRLGRLTFRHPLMRSAIPAAADPGERLQAHRALAETLRDQADRWAWHRAAATAGTSERTASALELAADRALRRGGVDAAIAALEHAARLSKMPDRLAERLLRAAELAFESGQRDLVEHLVRKAETVELSARQRAIATWLPSSFEDGVREDTSRTPELAFLAESVAADGDVELAMRILWSAAMRCFWTEPGSEARRLLLAVADRLPIPADDPRIVAISAYGAPFERGDKVLAGLRALAAAAGEDAQADRFLSSASVMVGAFDLAARFSASAVPGLRAQGRLGLLARVLTVQAWSCVRLGDLPTALPVAAEAVQMAHETNQRFICGLAKAVQAEIAALRGDYEQATTLVKEAEQVGLAAGARPVLATAQLARGLVAFGEGRFDDAFADLRRMLDPADPAYQFAIRACAVSELTEAAVRSGQSDAARDIVNDLESLGARTPSPALEIGLRYARTVLSPREDRDELFAAALEADLTGWPLERGRLQLAFGEWLRRQRRVVESRTHLRAARDTFDALGVHAWADRARAELRTAGEPGPRRGPDARDRLTPHELGIAQLAADGLTNREIGQRLYLSHRTVSTHLSRIFPKLGVSSRADLGPILRSAEAGQRRSHDRRRP
ncbi:AAA family ATPase [Saccharopolyspora sp. K220]|uniref:ATP-binding protein n=1 Tax=Saccharopolyspora soli TaxID=2926618 RepID=UPI001F5853AA|nr:LuxR family transcriptional regulator [Saccharopolyspora soli]MCI2422958.1 AAA family ATPase [Saccharopolyspora soli]